MKTLILVIVLFNWLMADCSPIFNQTKNPMEGIFFEYERLIIKQN